MMAPLTDEQGQTALDILQAGRGWEVVARAIGAENESQARRAVREWRRRKEHEDGRA